MNGNDDDSPEGNISSEPALLDSGKDYIDPERIKKWKNEEMLGERQWLRQQHSAIHKSHPTPLAKKALKRKFDAHTTTKPSPLDFDQQALNRAGFEGIDTLFPQSNRRLSTRLIHTYPTRRRPLRNDWKHRSYISYNCNCGSLLSRKNILAWKIFKVTAILFRFETISKHPYLFFWRPLHLHANA